MIINKEKKLLLSYLLKQYKQSLKESTGCDCNIFKAKDGRWYLQLQTGRGSEEYSYYGPFSDDDAADRYLSKNFANPGGLGIDESGTRDVPKKFRK